jgi:hypothetical protein
MQTPRKFEFLTKAEKDRACQCFMKGQLKEGVENQALDAFFDDVHGVCVYPMKPPTDVVRKLNVVDVAVNSSQQSAPKIHFDPTRHQLVDGIIFPNVHTTPGKSVWATPVIYDNGHIMIYGAFEFIYREGAQGIDFGIKLCMVGT